MMGYSDPGASCFLQLELLHFVRIIKYPLDESKGEDNFVVGALPWECGKSPNSCINEWCLYKVEELQKKRR